jgi:hypothetical protein
MRYSQATSTQSNDNNNKSQCEVNSISSDVAKITILNMNNNNKNDNQSIQPYATSINVDHTSTADTTTSTYLKSHPGHSIRIQKDKNPTIPQGTTATLRSKQYNTTPLAIPPHVGDVWHLDIGYRPRTTIRGVKYTLMAVDQHSRYKLVYRLKNL